MLELNESHAGKQGQLVGCQTRCTILGTYNEGAYVRVRLSAASGCHLAGDIVDYGADWVRFPGNEYRRDC